VDKWLPPRPADLSDDRKAMVLAIALAAENVRCGTGGPFGAVVVARDRNELISVGVNLVTASGLSIAHAEMVALSLAQQRLGTWNLASQGSLALVTSCEPCAMCFGAIPWSGVRELVCGARKHDAEAAGFDEGAKPGNWIQSLKERGIEVHQDLMRAEAAELLRRYGASGGEIYNADPDSRA